MIFALATLFDLKMPPYSAEAMEYYILARIALRWAPPTYDTTLAAIQSMVCRSLISTQPCTENLLVVHGTIP